MTPLAALLQRQAVWRGGAPAAPGAAAVPTGFAALDRELPGGGWPAGGLTEVLCRSEGIGELQIVLPALAALTAAGHRVAWLRPAAPALRARAARRRRAPGAPDGGARPRAARRAVGGGAGAARARFPCLARMAAAGELPRAAAARRGGAGRPRVRARVPAAAGGLRVLARGAAAGPGVRRGGACGAYPQATRGTPHSAATHPD